MAVEKEGEREKVQIEEGQPPHEPMLQFFRYQHLPPHLAAISRPFCQLAHAIVKGDSSGSELGSAFGLGLRRNPERTEALRKLLEAKDAAVRTALYE